MDFFGGGCQNICWAPAIIETLLNEQEGGGHYLTHYL